MARTRWFTLVALIGLLSMTVPVSTQAKDHGHGHGDDGNGSFSNQSLNGTYSFRLTSVKSFAADAAALGDPAGLGSAPRQDILRVGVFTADGNGNVSGHTIATTDTNNGSTELIDFTWSGTYTINSDGTGTLIVNDPDISAQQCRDMTNASSSLGACSSDDEGAESYSIVLNRHGESKTVDMVETDNVGGGAKIFMTGQAKRQ
jgi:hypothetical protein